MAYRYRRQLRLWRTPPVYRPPVPARPRVEILRPRVRPRRDLRVVEDRRTFHPLGRMRPAATFSRRDQRRIVEKVQAVRSSYDPFSAFVQPAVTLMPAGRPAFAVPSKVAVCVRRKQRREALFAFRKTRKGSGSRRRRNEMSEISCQ